MAFHDDKLPVHYRLGWGGGPKFENTLLEVSSGDEKRNTSRSRPRRVWNITFAERGGDASYWDTLEAFYYARQGDLHSFRFEDPFGNQITTQTIATTDGATDRFQLFRRFSSGGTDVDIDTTKIVSGSATFFFDGSEISDSNYTLGLLTGILDFSVSGSPSVATAGQVLSGTWQYDIAARFGPAPFNPTEPKPGHRVWQTTIREVFNE